MKTYYVYITTNRRNTVLYTGMTNFLDRRMFEHMTKINPKSFTTKYNINKLVYYDIFYSPIDAIAAEKKIKGWTRIKKINLINKANPKWNNLFNKDSL